MSIFKRLRNLWKLSSYDVADHRINTKLGDYILPILKMKKDEQAKIVDMNDPLSIDLGDNK